jgi:hypothetical protein
VKTRTGALWTILRARALESLSSYKRLPVDVHTATFNAMNERVAALSPFLLRA